MNNLKQSWQYSINLKLQSKDEVLLVSAFDVEQRRLFFASSSNYIYSAQIKSSQEGVVEYELIELETGDTITTLDYLMEKESLLVGTSNGHLLLYTGKGNPVEFVGQVEGGVHFISPSPDGDLIGIITGFGQLLMMTPDWDLLYEIALEDVSESEHAEVCESTRSNSFDGSISWRGDGKYYSTLSVTSYQSHLLKTLKVWERDSGELHAASESKQFMGSALDWMPSGPKIAAVYDGSVDKKGPSIVFFERNGLERSSFSIDKPVDASVESLKWNCNSDLIAAVVRCDRYDYVNVWNFSNNHWYLKQEIRYPKEDQVKIVWDPTKPLQLICWTIVGQVSIYNYVWVTTVMDNSMAFVIDGSNVLVTPLFLSLMPPPMYLFRLKFSGAVCEIAFCSENSRNRLAVFLANGCLSVMELPLHDNFEDLEGKDLNVEACDLEVSFQSLAHLTWLDSRVLLGVSQFGSSYDNGLPKNSFCKSEEHKGDFLLEFELSCSEDQVPDLATCGGWHARISGKTFVEELVVGISPDPTKSYSALIQFSGGNICEYFSKLGYGEPVRGPHLRKCSEMSFSTTCPWMRVYTHAENMPSTPLLVGLDETGGLYVGGRRLCSNCNSFSFYSNFNDQIISHLIFSTKQDSLFVVDIADVLNGNLEVTYANSIHVGKARRGENETSINMWERGAKIVGVLHGDEAAVIIQTLRGNLECIYPRKLVLASIVNALVQRRFRDAVVMVRRHRIDFNIIIDHLGWREFVQSASEFVKQVNNLSYVTELVCSMKNENVTQTLYKNYFATTNSKEDQDVRNQNLADTDKVSFVLLNIRKALEDHVRESPARELCILTTFARSSPPALDKALERIKVIRELEISGVDDPRRSSYPSAEEALKHLLWLSDSEAVYVAALGLYDLSLAAMVALNSQRDPKEFLPFLQGLECMPAALMRYNVDLRLHRYESALRNIVSAGGAYYGDFMKLMKDNPHLFALGLQLCSDIHERRQVLEAWGDHLNDEKCFEEAAPTYLCCSSLEKALKAYRACGCWSGVLSVAGLLKLGKEDVLQLAHELCEELQMLGKPGDAAKIALEYCGDVNGGVNLLISARDWEEALRVSFLHRSDELVSSVKDASLECASTLVGEYGEGLEKVGKYLARYLAVRQRRLLLAAKLQSESQSVNDFDDTASETSSTFSGMSAYTTGTLKSSASISSKNSKAREVRRQRNKGKIRAGSPGEELALVDHLKGMSLASGARAELKSLLAVLLILGKEEIARKLQHVAESFQLSQMAAVKLTEDTMPNDYIDEHAHTLNRYTQQLRSKLQESDAFSWRAKVLISP